jgi:hypothetical protein
MRYEESNYKFNATVAKREAVPALICLWGHTGCGKTYSALLLARGLVGPQGKICLLDTENKRAQFYADISSPWIHLDIQPPFTPEKYSEAFRYLRNEHKADIIIVDSMSHVWEGEGGILDMAENAKTKAGFALTGLAKWKDPKLAHKRMANDIIRSPIHVIFCLRQKDIMKTIKDEKGKDQYVFDRHVPIAEKNFAFEMTVALRLTKDGYYDADLHPLYHKVPEGLKSAFPPGGRINEAMGKRVTDWLAGGTPIDPALKKLQSDARDAAHKGTAVYQKFWNEIGKEKRAMIENMHLDMKNTAAAVDEEAKAGETVEKTNALFKPKADDTKCLTCGSRGSIENETGKEPCPDCNPN